MQVFLLHYDTILHYNERKRLPLYGNRRRLATYPKLEFSRREVVLMTILSIIIELAGLVIDFIRLLNELTADKQNKK